MFLIFWCFCICEKFQKRFYVILVFYVFCVIFWDMQSYLVHACEKFCHCVNHIHIETMYLPFRFRFRRLFFHFVYIFDFIVVFDILCVFFPCMMFFCITFFYLVFMCILSGLLYKVWFFFLVQNSSACPGFLVCCIICCMVFKQFLSTYNYDFSNGDMDSNSIWFPYNIFLIYFLYYFVFLFLVSFLFSVLFLCIFFTFYLLVFLIYQPFFIFHLVTCLITYFTYFNNY